MTDTPLFTPTPADEDRHPVQVDEGPFWGESWYLDWADADGAAGGYVRLGLYPNQGVAWWWIALVGRDRPTILTVEHEMPCPDGMDALSVHTDDVEYELTTLEPYRRFRVAGRATGVVLPDAPEAYHGLRGERVSVELDLVWESRAEVFPYPITTRYELSAWVTGTVTVDGVTTTVDCEGQRDHSWGVRDWWLIPHNWTSGRFEDGSYVHGSRSLVPGIELFAVGYTVDPDGALAPAERIETEVDLDDEQNPTAARQHIGGVDFTTTPVAHAPVLLVSPEGKVARFSRSMCLYEKPDGTKGAGWTEYNWPQL